MSSTPITSHPSEERSVERHEESGDELSEESMNQNIYQDSTNEVALVGLDTIQGTTIDTIPSDLDVDTVEETVQYSDVPLCRICWSDGTDNELISLPCKCQGTVGNVHADCLKEWERIRKSRRCEICKDVYLKRRHLLSVLRNFFQYRYGGYFLCKLSNITATAIIAYANIVLGEVNIAHLLSSEKASISRNGFSYPFLILSAAIFPYFAINYLAMDFVMSEMIDCYQIIQDWWYNES